ncbi:hypothetical protein [Cellulomonas persica]|uniref:Uncharacterized protein n=1 Tax=Cellulomonas persica TaxID=76861 RepID=A0A510UPM0_9CELL|nr:hypothetical protein CPE01_02320 [Cellulomonas persica]
MTDTPGAGTPTGPSSGDRSPTVAARASFGRTVGVSKPWGHEALFADGTHGYVGKLIFVRAGRERVLDEVSDTPAGARARRRPAGRNQALAGGGVHLNGPGGPNRRTIELQEPARAKDQPSW